MKLEQQVTSLEISKRLKELGLPQDSLFYWCGTNDKNHRLFTNDDTPYKGDGWYVYSAFTVAELGEMLPELCLSGKANETGNYNCWLFDHMAIREIKHYNTYLSENEADARAKMLTYLLENNLITL